MRTYRKADWDAAQAAWAFFDMDTWGWVRTLAGERGMLFPPSGDAYDSADEDASPSQRAIVYRAIVDTPVALRRSICNSTSWADVVRRLIAELELMRAESDAQDARDRADADAHRIGHHEASRALASLGLEDRS